MTHISARPERKDSSPRENAAEHARDREMREIGRDEDARGEWLLSECVSCVYSFFVLWHSF